MPFLFKSSNATAAGLLDDNDEGARIRRYSELLMPLLFETWMEVRPAALNDLLKFNMAEDDLHISNEAAFTLKTILEIIEKLHELMSYWDDEVNNHDLTEWFRTTYNKEFCAQFLLGFPYLQGDGFKGELSLHTYTMLVEEILFHNFISGSKRKSKGAPTEQDVHEAGGSRCLQQNLNLAYIFCCLNSHLTKAQVDTAERVIKFLRNNLQQFENQPQEVTLALVKVLRAILIDNGERWIKLNVSVRELLQQVMALYQKGRFAKDIRTKVLILLCDIVLNYRLSIVYGYAIRLSFSSSHVKHSIKRLFFS